MKAKLGIAAWLGWFALAGAARAQTPWHLDSTYQPPRVQFDLAQLSTRDVPLPDPSLGSRATRAKLFGMPTGFLSNPLGLSDDDVSATAATASSSSIFSPASSDDYRYLQVNFGNHNPYFDLRRPGDPGGVGYYRLHSQLQVVDVGTTTLSIGLNAFTPAGFDSGGLNNGPTYVSPNVAWYHDLADRVALQGYVGQNINAHSGWASNLGSNVHGGMALQYALPGTEPTAPQGCYLFLQALGRYRYESGVPTPGANGPLMIWDFVPGVHFRWNDHCWMSLGVSRYHFLSCAWQF